MPMITALSRSTGNTVELTITIPWTLVQTSFNKIFDHLLGEVEVAGFRKGKAPRNLAEKQIDRSKVYEEVIRELVPQVYADALKEHNLKPIIAPKVELVHAEENKDWQIKITTCEKPEMKLGNYKEAVHAAQEGKTNKIWVPGQDKSKDKKEEELTVGEVLDALLKVIDVELSPIMIEQEVNRMLSNLINETQKLGLTIDQYVAAQGKSIELLKKEYAEDARKSLGLEFALEEIAEQEKVTVDDKEIEEVIKNAKTPQEQKVMSERRYYITSLLRRQKTIGALLQSRVIKVE